MGGEKRLSGPHELHLDVGAVCGDCHRTAGPQRAPTIADPRFHADGTLDLDLPEGVTYDGQRCDGVCHEYTFEHFKVWEVPTAP